MEAINVSDAWIEATYEALFFDGSNAHVDRPCQVLMYGGRIEVRFVDDGGIPVLYVGTERGQGHFELTARKADGDGRATLHRFAAS
jgi:hypothetical protein